MIVFISNFLNHHQLHLCKQLLKYDEFYFIASSPTFPEQLKLGYDDMNEMYDFVVRAYENSESLDKAQRLLDTADVVIAGSCAFDFNMLIPRLQNNKLTFWFSERLFKYSPLMWFYPPTYKRVHSQCTKYRNNSNFYLLCAGGFVYHDYIQYNAFKDKAFSWGYFPEVFPKDLSRLFAKKEGKLKILWTARYLKLKRPKLAVAVAEKLKKAGIDFELNMLGSGAEYSKIEKLIKKKRLSDCVKQLGAVPFVKVREFMDEADIFLFTSTRREGWGAVLNESMNSACAVVASESIGGAKSIIVNGENGLLFKTKSQLIKAVTELTKDKEKIKALGENAYKTVLEVWSAENAGERFYKVSQALLNGEEIPLYENGPMKKE